MKKYRIKRVGSDGHGWYRVDKRHWFLFIPYWDLGATDMMPSYDFQNYDDAVAAVREKLDKYIKF